MPECTATSQLIPAHTDLSWNRADLEKSAQTRLRYPPLHFPAGNFGNECFSRVQRKKGKPPQLTSESWNVKCFEGTTFSFSDLFNPLVPRVQKIKIRQF